MLAIAVLGLGGCASFGKFGHGGGHVEVTPAATVPAPAVAKTPAAAPVPPLADIINGSLQHGRYAEGERDLRAYLAQHPGDRLAQLMLRQVTTDPRQWLGAPAQSRVAQPGDSYSTLAHRYLGDARLFVLLARYNESDNPSLLRVGQSIRLPATARLASAASSEASDDAAPRSTRPVAESRAQRSQRLQRESLNLLDAGRQAEALARLDNALAIDPGLAGNDKAAVALRQQLIASCHQRAIVLYRDQKLDPAIALWDRVLAIDPSYEPALAYRARAQELKRRLKQY